MEQHPKIEIERTMNYRVVFMIAVALCCLAGTRKASAQTVYAVEGNIYGPD
jgi:hypothetical protein